MKMLITLRKNGEAHNADRKRTNLEVDEILNGKQCFEVSTESTITTI